jgi:hypothetical protein
VFVTLHKGPKIDVEAQSESRSLLVLPFEFSHCLRINGVGIERMVPVNLAQIGVVIRGRASLSIQYRYGLVAGTTCRGLDLERIKALDLEDAATGRLFRDLRLPPRNPTERRPAHPETRLGCCGLPALAGVLPSLFRRPLDHDGALCSYRGPGHFVDPG